MTSKLLRVTAILFFAALSSKTTQAQERIPSIREITVTGTADVKTSPDQVVMSLGVNSADRELGIARAQNDKLVKTIIAAAHKLGVGPEDVQTSSLNMRAEYSDEKVPKFIGYQVSQSIDVILKDPTKYETLMSSFLEAGGNAVHGIRFVVSDERKYRDEARTKA